MCCTVTGAVYQVFKLNICVSFDPCLLETRRLFVSCTNGKILDLFWYLSVREINVHTTSPQNFKYGRRAAAFILAPPVGAAALLSLLTGCILKQVKVCTICIISLTENDSFRKDFCFTHDVFFLFFLPTRDLRDAWADRREILHDGQ